MKRNDAKQFLFLQISVLIFSTTGIFSKLAANQIASEGILSAMTLFFFSLMFLSCLVYAIFWQQNLKHYDVHVAYAHRSVYNAWSLVWAVLVFSEAISVGNMVGTVCIILGIVVMQSE